MAVVKLSTDHPRLLPIKEPKDESRI